MSSEMQRKTNPVWGLYDSLRDARFNTLYFATKMTRAKRKVLTIEVLLAIVVPSSGLSGLAVWKSTYGSTAWGSLVVVASLLAVVKPLLRLTDGAENYAATAGRWRTIELQLARLRSEIVQDRRFSETIRARYYEVIFAMAGADQSAPIETPDERLSEHVQETVLKEMPVDSFYIPEEEQKL